MVAAAPVRTDFSLDVLGRYVCNGLDEARASADAGRPDTRPFDVIVVGGGSFGPVVAQHLFHRAKARRILVLEAGPLVLGEHVQNLPMLGLKPAGATSIAELRQAGQDRLPREEVWGLAWHSDVRFPGLAYCLGGRSLYFGGWSPPLLAGEMPADRWPQAVIDDLADGYFAEAAEQIGTDVTNDFIYGDLHDALRQRLFEAIGDGRVRGAIPLGDLPDHPLVAARGSDLSAEELRDLLGLPADGRAPRRRDALNLVKLEAPLAVQTRTRPGFFPFNKFSALPLLVQAARAAWAESGNSDARKRLMIVPHCHVTRLAVGQGRVVGVDTDQGPVAVPPGSAVVLALGTIESARLALLSFGGIANAGLIGRNLMAHLRSNLTVRFPRGALPRATARELQASALFVKGRRDVDGRPRHFHLQITAAGLGELGTDSEAELFKKIPDIDTFDRFRGVTDSHIVVTIRGIGEMQPANPDSFVRLDPETDEYGQPRAFVAVRSSQADQALWAAMDQAADDVARALAGDGPYQVLTAQGFAAVAAGQAASAVLPFERRRDGLGTTHHEAGTLWMGDDPTASVTDPDARFHHLENAYVAGPALLPSIGSPNPMLSGVALARRLADHLADPAHFAADRSALLFDGTVDNWRMAGNGAFAVADGALEAHPGEGLGLYWCTTPTPPDFVLELEWRRSRHDDNSGVFVRFPDPTTKGYDNPAWVAVDFGFEVQIDELGRDDGADIHKTGAIYGRADQKLSLRPASPPGQWNHFEIRVQGQTYTVALNGEQVSRFDNPDDARGRPTTAAAPSHIGLQAHTGQVAFRNIRVKAL